MQLPQFIDVYQGLISTPSISSTDPSWDQGNAKVIEMMATWFTDLGFAVETEQVEPGKYNLMAKMGNGEG
ncbi:acetylornithine deacetylase, partial [Vibrio campbellii]